MKVKDLYSFLRRNLEEDVEAIPNFGECDIGIVHWDENEPIRVLEVAPVGAIAVGYYDASSDRFYDEEEAYENLELAGRYRDNMLLFVQSYKL